MAVVGAIIGIKFGLPSVTRDVQAQSTLLIANLKDELELKSDQLEEQQKDHGRKIRELEACRTELRSVKIELRDTQGELLHLYRVTGQKPSRHLTDSQT